MSGLITSMAPDDVLLDELYGVEMAAERIALREIRRAWLRSPVRAETNPTNTKADR